MGLLRGAALAVAAVWLAIVLAWAPSTFALTFDDAYYYFEIARNLADGAGSTFDGINETNGYHPLWLGVGVATFAVGFDDVAAVRTLLALQVVAYGAALVVLASVVDRAVDSWPRLDDRLDRRRCTATVVAVFVLAAGNPFVAKTFVNGMETGVTVVLLAALVLVATSGDGRWLGDDRARRWRLGVGALLALLFLGRTDAAVIVGCLGLWTLPELPALARRHGPMTAGHRLVELFAIPAATMAAFAVVNQVAFGGPLQISGVVKRAELTPARVAGLLAAAGLALAVGVLARRRAVRLDATDGTAARLPRLDRFVARTGWFAAALVLLGGYYAFASQQQWLWYFAPHVLYGLVLLTLAAADMAEGALVEARSRRHGRRSLLAVQAALAIPLVVGLALVSVRFADPGTRSIQVANRVAGDWISENLPADAVLGSWDAGVVGYFTDQAVIGLDGVVNSYDYRDARAEGRRAELLADQGMGWLVNHGDLVDGTDPDIAGAASGVLDADDLAGMELRMTWPFRYEGTTTGSGAGGPGVKAVFLYEVGG